MTHPPDHSMNVLSVFQEVLHGLQSNFEGVHSKRLAFVDSTMMSYQEVESTMRDYLKEWIPKEAFHRVVERVDTVDQKSRLCELLLEMIAFAEATMDQREQEFQEILTSIHDVRMIEYDGTNFREETIDSISLIIYDCFPVIRGIRKALSKISKTYHVPYEYETEDKIILLRSSFKTTYKNAGIIFDDFSLLSQTLWYLRHYNYFDPENQAEDEQPSSASEQVGKSEAVHQ